MTRPILQIGDPELRRPAQPVGNILSPAIQTLIDQLLVIVHQTNGVGIAAPQVGEPVQLMVLASRPNLRYPTAPLMAPMAVINPRLVAVSETMVSGWEGCLSVPDQRGWVPRHQAVTVACFDRYNQPQTLELTGFIARIFQHEYDHFNGVLFPDRVAYPDDLISEVKYLESLSNPTAHGGDPTVPNRS
jgi:peptide deformylase